MKLMERLGAKQKEKSDVLVAIDECQEKLEASKQRVEEILKEDAQILKELKGLCGDSPFWEQLFKTFKRKIKRVKPKELTGDDESDEEIDRDLGDLGDGEDRSSNGAIDDHVARDEKRRRVDPGAANGAAGFDVARRCSTLSDAFRSGEGGSFSFNF